VRPAPNGRVDARGLWLVAATAFVGCLHFVGINLGYLSFAGALPELRLRYFITGIFVLCVLMRLITAVAFRVYPTRLAFGMYAVFAAIVGIQALWYAPMANGGGKDLYISTIGETIVASGIMAITGETLAILWMRGRTALVKGLVGGALAFILGTIVLGVSFGWSSTAEMRLLFSGIGEVSYNYQSLGDSAVILGLLYMGLLKRTSSRLAALVVFAAALFFAYSRTSFFLFLIVSPLVLFIGGRNAEKLGIAAGIAIVLGGFVLVARESETLGPSMERMTVLLFEREADESFLARQALLAEGLQNLRENWMLGRFLDEWWRSGIGGYYMHNWLSFWQSYGFFPFIGSLALFGGIGFALFKQLARPRSTTGATMALFTYAMLAIVTARGYSWSFLWLALGITATAVYAQRNDVSGSPPVG
jgi:hypothetical protein